MIIVANDQLVVVDVDDTIIRWLSNAELLNTPAEDMLAFKDPYDGTTRTVVAHEPNIKILKDRKKRGCVIMVWSQSGYAWAAEAVKILGLNDYVDYVATKPFMALDDMPTDYWMPKPVCLKHDSNWAK